MHPDDVDRVREHTLAVEERGGKVSSNQFRRRHKEGHYVYFSVSSMVKGERFYSQEHSIDNEIRRQSMLDKQGYISTTAHDLRTPLTVFQSSIDILQQSKLTEEQLDVLQQTQAAVDLMHMISSNMMEVGKQDAGEPIKPSVGPVDIKTLLDRCQMLVEGTVPKADTDVNLIIEMDPSLSTPIVTDRCWVWTMMMNYLRNAFRFTHDGEIRVVVTRRGDFLRFEVRDTGIGVEHDKLFEPHPSGKRGATGGMRHLGLHSVKMKCERLGGSCGREDNESGVGSIFFFEVPDRKGRGEGENSRPSTTTRGPEPAIKLPTTTSQVEVFAQSRRPGKEAAKEAKEAGEVAEQPRALVIDDTASVRKLLSRMLESKDIKCDEARNGLEGLHMMRAKTYSVVLCDAFMPVMGGMECIRRFRNWEATHRVTRQFVVGISSYLEGFDRYPSTSVFYCSCVRATLSGSLKPPHYSHYLLTPRQRNL
ncbi:unnamed protein product [Chrysoparadoxa australica]